MTKYEILTLVLSGLAFIVSIGALCWYKISLRINITNKIIDDWNSSEYTDANRIIHEPPDFNSESDWIIAFKKIEGFFEKLGILYKKNYIERNIVLDYFQNEIIDIHNLMEQYKKELRVYNRTIQDNFNYLYKETKKFQKKELAKDEKL